VAQSIVNAGLTDFYQYRTDNQATGQQLIPDVLQQLEIYDNPAIQKRFVHQESAEISEAALILEGITCAACVWLNERHLHSLPGVLDVKVNYSTHRANVRWDRQRIQLSDILKAIAAIGYVAHPYDPQRQQAVLDKERKQQLRRIGITGALGMQIMMFSIALYAGDWQGMEVEFRQLFYWINLALTIPIMLYAAQPFFQSAWRDLKHRQAGMDVPVALGLSLAFIGSVWTTLSGSGGHVYYDSIAMFVFFLLTGRFFELMARQRSARAAESLLHMVPTMATRLVRAEDNAIQEELVLVTELEIDDTLLIRAGDNIPADGCVTAGVSSVDESLLTGESYPIARQPGQPLIAGTVNIESPLQMRVEKLGADTVLSHITRLLERAQTEKPVITQVADRVAGWFVLAVIILAMTVGWTWWQAAPDQWLSVTLAVLVVTCPCALSLATPTAITAATSTLTRSGLLITRGHALETLAKATHFVFDKTGTLTKGQLRVVHTETFADWDRQYCLAYAAALERHSEHPIAQAVLNAHTEHATTTVDLAESVTNFPGAGLQGDIAGQRFFIGTDVFIQNNTQLSLPDTALQTAGYTLVWLASTETVYAVFALDDEIRAEADELIAALKAQGHQVLLLSGDQQASVQRVASTVGIDNVGYAMTPAAKLARVKTLQAAGAVVAMIGDGVNDAPVLAQAQVSIAMGSGTQVARASADMILLTEQLPNLLIGIRTAHQTLRIIRQNILWAIGYNLLALPAAALGYIAPWMAAIGMSASSLLVVTNALRLVKSDTQKKR